jgi:rod shape-determining protein MreD
MLPRGEPLLLPAKPGFIWGSLVAAGMLMVLQGQLGAPAWWPDWLALVLTFWSVHQPRRIGVGVAFAAGLLLDVHQGALLGQHALAYTVLAYGAVSLHRRVLWFDQLGQTLHVLPLVLLAYALQWLVRWLAGDGAPSWALWVAPVLPAACCPLPRGVRRAPNRGARPPDDTRPL